MDEKSTFQPEAWTKLWADMTAAVSSAATGQAFAGSQEDAARKVRQAFFDAWAKTCDEFLHSEQFLEMMKRSMDSTLAFREQMNKFLARTLDESPMSVRGDTDAILQAVRTLEERVMGRLDELSDRVDALEAKSSRPRAPSGSGARSKRKGGRR